MGRRLGLLEVSVHGYLLPTFCRLAAPDRNDVTVYTTAEDRDRIQRALDADTEAACSWVCKDSGTAVGEFLGRVEDASADLDALWVLTPTGPGALPARFCEFSPDCPLVAVVHNATEFEPPSVVRQTLVPPAVRLLDRVLPASTVGELVSRNRRPFHRGLLDRLDAAVVFYPRIQRYLADRPWWDVPTRTLFPVVYRGPSPPPDDGTVRLVVPGRIHTGLRSYEQVLDVIERLRPAVAERVQLTLLGRTTGGDAERVVDRCLRLADRGHDVRCYPDTDWIPHEEFERQLRRSDLVLAPVRAFGGETRPGRRHTTGAVQDALRYGRPIVLPSSFPVAPEIADAVVTYDDRSDLADLLDRVVTEPAFRDARQSDAADAAADFGIETQRTRFAAMTEVARERFRDAG